MEMGTGEVFEMTCRHCGAKLSLDEKECSYCGAVNEEAKEYVENIEHYDNEFSETKIKVIGESKRLAGWMPYVIVICILFSLNVIVFAGREFMYDIIELKVKTELADNIKKYEDIMNTAIEEEQYYFLERYYTRKDCYLNDQLRSQYGRIVDASRYYNHIFRGMLQLQNNIDETEREECVGKVAQNIVDFYNQDKYNVESDTTESNAYTEVINDMKEKIEQMLVVYASFHEEEIKEIDTMSKRSIQQLLEERREVLD